MLKYIKPIFFICLLLAIGFFRESLFIRIEWHTLNAMGKADAPQNNWLFTFLAHKTVSQLYTIRIVATLLSCLIFWSLCLLMVRWFFNTKPNFTLVHVIFASVFGVGCIVYALSLVLPFKADLYTLSRWIIGLIESPLIVIILFPLFWVKAKMDRQ